MMSFEPLFVLSGWSVVYWIIAFLMSVFWGCYSLEEVNKSNPKQKRFLCIGYPREKQLSIFEKLTRFDAFISDFLLSLLGWGALYLLLWNGQDREFDNFDIFLGSVAVLCITGYGFKIADRIKIG